ncbi:MAG TPA: zinc-binding dehydrogenase [Solirubrobacterales bacterium]|jgi:NADPH2:quinone reductase|nr:zinc-binding dehydrogenase [Solirubrobacterales bacterium]
MKAILVNGYGGPEELRVEDLPVPTPGPGEVSIDVAYAGVNYAEVMARRGALPAFVAPFVPGLEVSGTVRAVGEQVEDLKPGQPVAALTTFGGYAEVALAPAAVTYPLAADGADELRAGAALPTIVPAAWGVVHEVARMRAGELALVHAAAGGVGTVLGQIARNAGVGRLVGVVSSEEKATYARRFGYDDVLVGEGWAEQARTVAGDDGFDIVFDSIGGTVRERSFDLLAPLGRIVFYGNASDVPEIGFPGSRLRAEVKATLGFSITALAAAAPKRARELALHALGEVASGEVTVPITEVLPLAEAPRAHELLEGRSTIGKLILEVAPR